MLFVNRSPYSLSVLSCVPLLICRGLGIYRFWRKRGERCRLPGNVTFSPLS